MESKKNYIEIGCGYVIMPYDYAHRLGRGAFADVYRCRKMKDGKILPEVYVAKEIRFQRKIPSLKEQILSEINIMLQLTGDYTLIVSIYDYFMGTDKENMYIIMEYCEGGDLDYYTKKNGPLTEKLIAELLHPLAIFFNEIHQRGIIHRDLKLANVLLAKELVEGEAPQLRITDFGLARVMETEEMAHTKCGTPLYMAPELWDKGNKGSEGYTCEVDVWAFGNMLYRMMYGEYAFEDIDIEKRLKQGIIRFPKIRLASIEALDLMMKCLRKNPIRRIKFDEIAEHPFFTKKEFEPFERMFDGYFGFIESNIDNAYDLLGDPGCLGIPEKPKELIDKHNEEVIAAWQQAKSLT